eukprot:CAMPEP_0198204880 /NCGR_PEP_ID=MMETSP1445-20131203/8365_1 /TAXON_ID=36898 /ORGANISM="Pyramimonas sp., Strain CCMP2087" /LENGTH=462 /DNA_ID=CAMNT_0043876965 /DNA_START=269 /DNA_END=1658 /DNA_ORIENTATION=-
MKRSRKAAQTGSTAEASQDASIPPSSSDPSTQLTEAHNMRGSGVARKPNARTISSPCTAQYSVVTVNNVSSEAASKNKPSSITPTSTRPRRPTSGQPYTKEESLRTEQIHTKEIVDLVLKLSKEDAEAAGNLLSQVFNHSNLRDAKAIAEIVSKEDNEINTDIVNNIRQALSKLANRGGHINSQRQTLSDGVLEAVVGANHLTKQHSVTSFATALGVDRRHIVAASKRQEESRDQVIVPGGLKRCEHEGCTKLAKASYGSTYCVGHGGGGAVSMRAAPSQQREAVNPAAKLTGEAFGVSVRAAPKQQKAALPTAKLTAEARGVSMRAAPILREAGHPSALLMEEGGDVSKKAAPSVQKATPLTAKRMAEASVVSRKAAPIQREAAHHIASLMEVASVVSMRAASSQQKAGPTANIMEKAGGVSMRAAPSQQKVAHPYALLMGKASRVSRRAAPGQQRKAPPT